MRTLFVVAFLALAVFAVARAQRSTPSSGPRRPRPGEGMRRIDPMLTTPEGLVCLRAQVSANEAHVMAGLLASAGIVAKLQAYRFESHNAPRLGAPEVFDLWVDPAKVDEARELLSQ